MGKSSINEHVESFFVCLPGRVPSLKHHSIVPSRHPTGSPPDSCSPAAGANPSDVGPAAATTLQGPSAKGAVGRRGNRRQRGKEYGNIWKPWWFFIVFLSKIWNPKDCFLVERNSFRLVLDLSLSEHVVLACKLDHPKDNGFGSILYCTYIETKSKHGCGMLNLRVLSLRTWANSYSQHFWAAHGQFRCEIRHWRFHFQHGFPRK